MNELRAMLSYRRPIGSKSEAEFIERFLLPLSPTIDGAGNLIVTVGKAPKVLFASHIDTVHDKTGRQSVKCDKTGLFALASRSKNSACLGADDTAGIWLMMNLIKREIPGLYIFHTAEEVGCIGAKYIYDETPGLLRGLTQSIEFDRRGRTSIVTHQMGFRCASNVYAVALGDALYMGHSPDPTGVFTDNEVYSSLIPETVNVSVGYEYAHSPGERLDSVYLRDLLERLSVIDFNALPIKRNPATCGEDIVSTYSARFDDSADYDLYDAVIDNPTMAATLLEDCGITLKDFETEIAYDELQLHRIATC